MFSGDGAVADAEHDGPRSPGAVVGLGRLAVARVDAFVTWAGLRYWVFARVTTDQGLYGWGEATVRAAILELGDRRPRRVLLKTANSAQPLGGAPFSEAYAGLTPDGTQFLIAHDVQVVGNDYLSVEPFASIGAGAPVHHALLTGGVSILEGISLAAVPPGLYFLAALPLRLQGSDGSPTRAVLLDVADVRRELESAA